MKRLTRFFEVVKEIALLGAFVFGVGLIDCSKNHLQEPPEDVHHDHEVVVVDSFHIHHDHQVVVIDTVHFPIFVICDTVDMTIEWTVTGDESAPNTYSVYLNDVFYDQFVAGEFPFGLTQVKFEIEFFRIVFGDVIRIEKEGSQAEVISSSIVDIKCSGMKL